MYSVFHPSGVGTVSKGELPLRGDEPRTFTKSLKRIGTNQGVATSQLGGTHIHAMHAGGRFGTSVERLGGQVCQGQLSLPSFQGRNMSRGNFRLARGELLGLTKGLKLWSYLSRPGGYYSGTLVTVLTAILNAVSLLEETYSSYKAPSTIV